MGKATQDLRQEHDSILYVLQILDKMMLSKNNEKEYLLGYYGEVIYFLKMFVDKCHHGKEEKYLFKELINIGIPNEEILLDEMLHEHTQGRRYVEQMSHDIDKKDINSFNNVAEKYRDLIHLHIEKEDRILFTMADKMIDEKNQDLLFEEFEQHEETAIGHGIHEKLHAMIDTWAEAFGVE